MESYKNILGIVSTLIAFVSYVPYFRGIFRNETRPHAISWFLWGLITAMIFVAQIVSKGGAGSWVTAVTALACFTISILAFIKSDKRFALFDWVSLCGALVALILWRLTNQPVYSVILLTVTSAIAYLPTFRKGFVKPQEEKVITYGLSGLKFVVALFALASYSVTTYLYPVVMIGMNWSFAGMLIVRNKTYKSWTV